MASNYNIQLVKKQDLKKTGQTRTQFHITKKGDKMIDIKDIQKIYNQFLAKGISAERIGLVGLNGERYTTIKSPHTDDIFDYFDDEYLDGKSSEVKSKLSKFFNLQLIIY
jgi:hypothetical protein